MRTAQRERVAELADSALETPRDIEDLAKRGQELSACAYYAARGASLQAHLVLLPYSALLHEDSRNALQLKVDGNVIVIDEAHNLEEAVSETHSAAITNRELGVARSAIHNYKERFRTRLGPSNLRHLSMLLEVSSGLEQAINNRNCASTEERGAQYRELVTLNQLLKEAGLESVNIFRLLNFVRENKILLKLSTYAEMSWEEHDNAEGTRGSQRMPEKEEQQPGSVSGLQAFVSFMNCLGNANNDGRIISEPHSQGGRLRYILLDPASRFGTIVSRARAVILTGGTLSPVDALSSQLFPAVPRESIRSLRCLHIVPRDHILCLAMGNGPTGKALNFSHKGRSTDTSDELGRILLNFAKVITPSLSLSLSLSVALSLGKCTGCSGRYGGVSAEFRVHAASAGTVEEHRHPGFNTSQKRGSQRASKRV